MAAYFIQFYLTSMVFGVYKEWESYLNTWSPCLTIQLMIGSISAILPSHHYKQPSPVKHWHLRSQATQYHPQIQHNNFYRVVLKSSIGSISLGIAKLILLCKDASQWCQCWDHLLPVKIIHILIGYFAWSVNFYFVTLYWTPFHHS